MQQIPLAQCSTQLDINKFWEVLLIYHNRPHLVNRKLLAASQVLFCELIIDTKGVSRVKDLFTRPALIYEIRKLKELSKHSITTDLIKNIVECYDKNVQIIEKDLSHFKSATTGIFISIRILLPRGNIPEKCVEVVILDKDNRCATFLCASEFNSSNVPIPVFPYDIELTTSSNLRLLVNEIEDADTSSAEWLCNKLFTKLLKWSQNEQSETTSVSLSLVSSDDYCSLYADLKNKYGKDLVKRWSTKATTSPQKFVFEDIAIAAYLICIWRKYSEKQNIDFVDCGCGNGLLVYILNAEGYRGIGLDLRRRPTWDLYPSDIGLKEEIVTPNSLFPTSTWIIGNHSDELTPWIPVIALKSSPKTNYFLLPCCSYDFSGKKYIRQNARVSAYSDYMDYVQQISEICGFSTKIDKLRIPSTKRTCFIGLQREYKDNEYQNVLDRVDAFLETKLSQHTFQHRIETNIPRNCTQLDKGFINKIIQVSVNKILSREQYINKENEDKWNKGTGVSLSDLSKELAIEDKKKLKNECGGLQTLLRNHRYIFEMKDDEVCLRLPYALKDTEMYKTKPCWFYINHPDGCIHESQNCAYNHCK